MYTEGIIEMKRLSKDPQIINAHSGYRDQNLKNPTHKFPV